MKHKVKVWLNVCFRAGANGTDRQQSCPARNFKLSKEFCFGKKLSHCISKPDTYTVALVPCG